ncbi:MAG: hemolysin family protein [Burkholderiales bacterium]
MEIALLVVLILVNGAFAMSEIALVAARKTRLQKLIDEGDARAAAAAALGADPTRFLSTIQIGITSIGVLNGIVGEAAMAAPLAHWLTGLGLPQPWSGWGATALVVVVITYVSIVLGELVPKRIGQNNPEAIARLVAGPVGVLARLTRPFVLLLSASTHAVLRAFGIRERNNDVTEEEIHALLEEGASAGAIEAQEHTMVRNVFRLDDRQIGSLMVPRGDVVYLDADAPFAANLETIEATEHARFPVMRGSPENILGVVNARKLLARAVAGGAPDVTAQLDPPLYVPETLTGMELLDNFRASGGQVAFVIDEYGAVQGMVTLQDLIEAITGEFNPRDPATSWAVQREDGSWLLDGLIPLQELKDRLGLASTPEEDRGRYHTLSGMAMFLTGRLPKIGDAVEWEEWRFEIVDMDGKKIDRVLATRTVGAAVTVEDSQPA